MIYSINIFGKSVPIYGFMGLMGVIAGFIYLSIYLRKDKKLLDDLIYTYVFCILFAMLGAKLLYLLQNVSEIIVDINNPEMGMYNVLYKYIAGGFVFYGGMIGGIAGYAISVKYFGLKFWDNVRYMLPTLPLIHGFGRIGCFLVGCCYGRETDFPLYIEYPNSVYAPNHIHLIPIQLYEAIGEFLIFFLLLICGNKFKNVRFNLDIYFISYGILRFILEIFRGDELRRHYGIFSTSQWISIIIILIAILHIIYENKVLTKNRNTV